MYTSLLTYFIFLFIVAFILMLIVPKLNIKNPFRFITFIMILIAMPVIIGYIYFSYFSSIPETIVPDVIGLKKNAASRRIEKMGLVPKFEAREGASNVITYQRPEPGKVVKFGRVVLIISGNTNEENPIPSSVIITPGTTEENFSPPEVEIELLTEEGE